MPKEPDDYASLDEARAALIQLTQNTADLLRLEKNACLRARGLKQIEGTDLLNTAIERVLAGTRRWPSNVPFIAFMASVMRSIASECREDSDRVAQNIIAREIGLESDQGKHEVANVPSEYPDPARELQAKEELATIMALFNDDEEAGAVLMQVAEGYSPKETQETFNMTPTQYATVLKRIRRKLVRLSPQDYVIR